jgi:hypothetical protein
MIRMAVCVSAVAVVTASTALLAQDRPSVRIEPGLWKVSIKFTQNDKPLPDKTENRCYSAAEVDDPVKTFAAPFPEHECSRGHDISDKTLAFAAVCSGPAPAGGTLSVKANGYYLFEHARRFTSQQITTFELPNQPSTVIVTSKEADYVGPCPSEGAPQ